MNSDHTGRIVNVFRADNTNVGDWYCYPARYFDLGSDAFMDLIELDEARLADDVVLGGGGLVAQIFARDMERLAAAKRPGGTLVAWGIGESLNVSRAGDFVPPYDGSLPDYLKDFDLVGLRDFGTEYRWVPCASCMLQQFDSAYEILHEAVVYEHKRIPVRIEGLPRRTNDGSDIEATLAFLGSAETVITNSYHGVYWATLLGRKVVCIPNMSKVYRLRHLPVLCRTEEWKTAIRIARAYPEALEQCRIANRTFYADVKQLFHKRKIARGEP